MMIFFLEKIYTRDLMSQIQGNQEIPFIALNPLANSKGVKKKCELCDKPAYD